MEEVDVKVPGVSRHILLPPLVSADIHYAPADHANLEGPGVPWGTVRTPSSRKHNYQLHLH